MADTGDGVMNTVAISQDDQSLSTEPPASVPSETVQDVLLTNDWLDGQLFDVLSSVNAAKQDVSPVKDAEMARERISKLQGELLAESSKLSLKELMIKRIQLGAALSNELFGPTEDVPEDTSVDNPKRKKVEELVLEQKKLVSEIMKEQTELDKLRKQVRELRQKNFEQKARNREAMNEIRQHQNLMEEKADDFRKNSEGQNKKAQLESGITKIIILRNTLQGLILGSGINWAQDPKMEELLLGLGEPLDL